MSVLRHGASAGRHAVCHCQAHDIEPHAHRDHGGRHGGSHGSVDDDVALICPNSAPPLTPPEMDAMIRREIALNLKIAKEAGLKFN
jgi:hypothetical protein